MRNLFLIILIFASLSAYAIPAKRIKIQVLQSDGQSLTIQLMGDEHLHYYATDDGVPVFEHENGDYYYASFVDGVLQASSRRAVALENRSIDDQNFVKQLTRKSEPIDVLYQSRLSSRSRVNSPVSARSFARRTTNYVGQRRGLVILVEFTDLKFQPNAHAHFDAKINQADYKANNHYGSVYDYFLDQSNGKLALNFDVVGPVTLTRNAAYYGRNNKENYDVRPATMVAEACLAVDNQVDFSQYDWDGDGEVEQVYVIYAGYSEAQGAPSVTIWPHMWALSSSEYQKRIQLDNTYVDVYACSSELKGKSGAVFDGIGTLCHEYSHCFGLPDFYDTSGASAFGLNSWSIMDYGSYGSDGNIPCGYTSYEKWFCGWQDPIELSTPTSVSGMKPLAAQGESYIIYNEADRNEYYLLENRQQERWDASLPGNGLLVLHVNYNFIAWRTNKVNSVATQQRMTIVPADNVLSATSTSLAGDPFPGHTKNNELSDTSTPRASLFNDNISGQKLMSKPLTHITQSDIGEISFDFMGGVINLIDQSEIDSTDNQQIRVQEMLNDDETKVYSLSGQIMPKAQFEHFPHGVYILINNQKSYKIVLR